MRATAVAAALAIAGGATARSAAAIHHYDHVCCQEQPSWPEGWGTSGAVCGTRAALPGGCASGDYAAAEDACARIGARLCTADEWGAQMVPGEYGCDASLNKIWSGDGCGGHRAFTYRGNDAGDATCSDPSDTAVIACCTDYCHQPTKAPVEPKPMRPTEYSPPTKAPVLTTKAPYKPLVPTKAPPTKAPAEPIVPVEAPTKSPVTPTDAPVEPVRPVPVPTKSPITPTDAPVKPVRPVPVPTKSPITPTDAPTTPICPPCTCSPTPPPLPYPTKAPVGKYPDIPAPGRPTKSPFEPPTAPTKAPFEPAVPTKAPIKWVIPADNPTRAPVKPLPVGAPTEVPVVAPTKSPVTPTDAPVYPPTKSPVTPTDAPVKPVRPVYIPTDAPVKPFRPVYSPTEAPARDGAYGH